MEETGEMMIAVLLAANATPTEGVPIWVTLAGLILAGGVVPAFQYLSKRNETKAGSATTEATANLTGVEALTNVISSLSTENGRLTTRLTDWDAVFKRMEDKLDASRDQVTALQASIEERPNKQDLYALVEKLRGQLVDEGVTPVNGPATPVKP